MNENSLWNAIKDQLNYEIHHNSSGRVEPTKGPTEPLHG